MTLFLKIAAWAARVFLAAFFLFVGYWKTFGPIDALAEHHAWVAGFPALFARAIGWQETLCAAALLTPAFWATRLVAPFAPLVLLVNQIAALAVHAARGEAAMAAPQNLILITLLGFSAYLTHKFGDHMS